MKLIITKAQAETSEKTIKIAKEVFIASITNCICKCISSRFLKINLKFLTLSQSTKKREE